MRLMGVNQKGILFIDFQKIKFAQAELARTAYQL
jgi:hypothetical protein